MTRSVNIEVPFEQLLEAVDRLETSERDLLRERLIQREEEALIRHAEQAVGELKLPDLPARLSYWSVAKVLDELSHRLEVYEQRFETDSKTLYAAYQKDPEATSAEEAEWARLYKTYHRLRAAKRRVDIKVGRAVEPLPVGEIMSKQLTLDEVKEELHRFETQHGMSSADFYESFKRGEQGDSVEAFRWVHTYTAYLTMSGNDDPKVAEDV